MKTNKLILCFLALAFASTLSIAQPGFNNGNAKFESGTVGFLKGQTALSVKFSYENMMVGDLTDEAYIIQKTKEQNRAKAKSGDTWATKWIADRVARYEPPFMEWFNKSVKKLGIIATSVTGEGSTKYTLLVTTTKTEPGVYVGVSTFGHDVGQETYINIMANIVETANPTEVLASISVTKCVGTSTSFANYDTGLRITNAYAIAGKVLGSFITKNCK